MSPFAFVSFTVELGGYVAGFETVFFRRISSVANRKGAGRVNGRRKVVGPLDRTGAAGSFEVEPSLDQLNNGTLSCL